MAKYCRFCGKEVGTEAKFCQSCGKMLALSQTTVDAGASRKVCKNCGNPVSPSAQFCRICGVALSPAPTEIKNKETATTTKAVHISDTIQSTTDQLHNPNIPAYKETKHPTANVFQNVEQNRQFKNAPHSVKPVKGVSIKSVAVFIGAFVILAVVVAIGLSAVFSNPKKPTGNSKEKSRRNKETVIANDRKKDKTENKFDNKESFEYSAMTVGNSRAFSDSPVEGITISGEKNALDHDREFTMASVSGEDFTNLASTLASEIDEDALLLSAWELDAGLSDDDLLPGTFNISFDLAELGIAPEFYECVSIYRIDDEGKWYEYAEEMDGGNVRVDSRQNCVISMVVWPTLLVFGPHIADGVFSNSSQGKYFLWNNDHFDVEIDGKSRFSIYWNLEDASKGILAACDNISRKIVKAAEERALKELKQQYGETKVDSWFTTDKKTNQKVFSPPDKEILIDYQHTLSACVDSFKGRDKDYQALQSQLNDIRNGEASLLLEDFYSVEKTIEACKMAYGFYVKKVGTEIMPTYKTRIELQSQLDANGVTIKQVFGNPYIILNISSEQYLGTLPLTVAHEFFHVCQRTYVGNYGVDFKFDEVSAMAVEAEAYDYYTEAGTFRMNREEALDNLTEYQHYAIPLGRDWSSAFSKVDPEVKFVDGTTFTGDYTSSCYALGTFFLYLKEHYTVNGQSVSYVDALKKYKSKGGDFITILKNVFSMDDRSMANAYCDFVGEKQYEFYQHARSRGGLGGFAPEEVLNGKKIGVKLSDCPCNVRVRKVNVAKRTEKDREFALLLKWDEEFSELLPDMRLWPQTFDENAGIRMEELEYQDGLYLAPRTFNEDEGQPEWYVVECNGGRNDLTKENKATAAYTLYPLYAPEKPKVVAEEDLLTLTLPDPSESPSYEVTNAYAVTIYNGEKKIGKIIIDYDDISKDHKWSGAFSKYGMKVDKDKLSSISVTISEIVKNTDLEDECYGPESERAGGDDLIRFAGWYEGTEDCVYEDGYGWSMYGEPYTLDVIYKDGQLVPHMPYAKRGIDHAIYFDASTLTGKGNAIGYDDYEWIYEWTFSEDQDGRYLLMTVKCPVRHMTLTYKMVQKPQ